MANFNVLLNKQINFIRTGFGLGVITPTKKITRYSEIDTSQFNQQTAIFLDIDETILNSNGELMDPHIPGWIDKVRLLGCKVYSLTARNYESRFTTYRQLTDHGIFFDRIPDIILTGKEEAYLPDRYKHHRFIVHNGICFTTYQDKGIFLNYVLKALETLSPEMPHPLNFNHIVFIDDLPENLESVEKALRFTSKNLDTYLFQSN